MSVFKSLTEEHALMLGLVRRLERTLVSPKDTEPATEIRNILLVLLKALDAHEQLENLVFEEAAPNHPGRARTALALIERQHLALGALRAEAADLLRNMGREDDATLQALAQRLTRLLRRHFNDEERTLWPTVHAAAGRSRLHRLERLAAAQVRSMRKELVDYWSAVSDYLI